MAEVMTAEQVENVRNVGDYIYRDGLMNMDIRPLCDSHETLRADNARLAADNDRLEDALSAAIRLINDWMNDSRAASAVAKSCIANDADTECKCLYCRSYSMGMRHG